MYDLKPALMLIIVIISGALGACTAPIEERLGYADEPCRSDRQCSPTLLCRQGICTPTAQEVVEACRRICARFVDECGRLEASCVEQAPKDCCLSSCSALIERWRGEAIAQFEGCSKELLSCQEVRSIKAANLCYVQLDALPEERHERCISMVERARTNPRVTLPVEAIDNACRILGRTGTDEDWANAEACADPSLEDEAFVGCLERSFTQAQPSFE